MRTFLTVLCFGLALFLAEARAEEPAPGKQIAQTIALPKSSTETEKQNISYLLFLPEDYDAKSEKTWPLMLFLHGAGETGTDIEKVKVHGPPKLLGEAEKRKEWPFITVSPQNLPGSRWTPSQLILLLDEIEKNYKVDKQRVYITGLSMGGFGTWNMLARYPDRFAAGAPICGGGSTADVKPYLEKPIWVFHGAKDNVVRVNLSTDLVDAIKAAGGTKVKLTIYPELQHDSWTVTYENPELYKWLLEQKLPPKKE